MYIDRYLEKELARRLAKDHKVILLFGARQVGKTTLIEKVLANFDGRVLRVDGDQLEYQSILGSQSLSSLRSLVAGYDLLFIDEAQRIPNIGINLKILHDHQPDLKIIATGSSSFDLARQTGEPLTGRAWTYTLYPISYLELSASLNRFELTQTISTRMIYGSYPETMRLENNEEKRAYLKNLSVSYIYKDIIQLADISHTAKIPDLLRLLSYQIGSLVSLSEIGMQLGMAKDTVYRYIDLLEKSFVVFRLGGLARNLRKEVRKMDKIYFFDLGVRNIFIDNLKPLSERDDVGKLWENFLLCERLKTNAYKYHYANTYFWRIHSGAELDYVEEYGGKLHGYEFKYGKKQSRLPKTWIETYPQSTFTTINQDNALDFILGETALGA